MTTTRLAGTATRTLLRIPDGDVAHIHLSERGSFLREGALIPLARRRGLVTVATIHGAAFQAFARAHPLLVSAVLGPAHLVTCLDRTTLDVVRSIAPSVCAEVVPNPVFVDRSFSPADGADEVVVFGGEIGLRKGADVLHRAWQLVARQRHEARCLMVGPVADFNPPQAERLEVRSPVDHFEMSRILRQARAVALPARAEGVPMILTEAMSLGRPFVSTPVGGIPDLAAGGLLVAVEDEIALANRLTDLLADSKLAKVIGERGRRHCLATRSIEIVDRRLRELYAASSELL